jgi:hypothetical protein
VGKIHKKEKKKGEKHVTVRRGREPKRGPGRKMSNIQSVQDEYEEYRHKQLREINNC